MFILFFKRAFIMAILTGITLSVFAEDAPVFDVDSYPPFDGQLASTPSSTPSSNAPSSPVSLSPQPQYVPQSLTIDQRIERAEQQINNMQHSDSTARLNALQADVQSLRGQVEELTHQLKQMQTQQQAMYSDLDKRLNKQTVTLPPAVAQKAATDNDTVLPAKSVKPKNKTKPSVTPVPTPEPVIADKPDTASAAVPSAPPLASKTAVQNQNMEQEELGIYQTAYDLIKAKKYDEAIAALQKMLQKYPSGQFAANAHYWLGELYGLQNKNEQAAVEFAKVVKNYPESPKVSDAEVKLGMIYAAQFKWADAKLTFRKVVSRYPGSTSARLATQQLREIKTAGH